MPHSLPGSAEDKYRLVLTIAQAVNSTLDFHTVLDTILTTLHPIVPIDSISVLTHHGEHYKVHAMKIRGLDLQSGEDWLEEVSRLLRRPAREIAAAFEPYMIAGSPIENVIETRRRNLRPHIDPNSQYRVERSMYEQGIRSYVLTPMIVGGKVMGSILLVRTLAVTPVGLQPFTEEEADFLEEVAGPLATAVINSLTYRDISRLKGQLEEENVLLREQIDEQFMFGEMIGASLSLRKILSQIDKVAATEATVLITGETGTGKELIAREIHKRSRRAQGPMVKVNCAAIPESLMASELFGHERGSFTGALQRRLGRFELASKGTIFLDEIGELPPEMQAALLRVLQEGEFERVGGSQTIKTEARVIAATNRNLPNEVRDGRFRSDLYYRLNVFPIHVPPLRDRTDDIPILTEYFVSEHGGRLGRRFKRVERETMDRLIAYAWPGNVRELENVIERAAILADGDRITVGEILSEGPRPELPQLGSDLIDREREAIESALAVCGGRVSGNTGAAARLGFKASTLESKIKRLKIDKFRYKTT